ncbi:MAG: BadF/BadG/BcrA/BcrD ATPase family protein, partial [Fimbriimonadales bacterium]
LGVIVGLEGGGTKTGCAVLDTQGNLLAYAEGGPANLNFVSEAQQRESFAQAIEGALGGIDLPVLALGHTVAGTVANWEWVLQRLGNPLAFPVEEARMAFVSTGTDHAHGLAVVAGTGALLCAFVRDELVRCVSGWGALLGDEGSAYDVALTAIRAAVRAWDGRAPNTKLVQAVQDYFGVSDLRELVPLFYQRGVPRHQIAGFAPHVIATAKRRDAVAVHLLTEKGTLLAEDALACVRGVFPPEETVYVALTGGMFRERSRFRQAFQDRFRQGYPRALFHTPKMMPAVAVARITLRRWRVSQM